MGAVTPCFVLDVSHSMRRLQVRNLVTRPERWVVQVISVPPFPGTAAPAVVRRLFTITVNAM